MSSPIQEDPFCPSGASSSVPSSAPLIPLKSPARDRTRAIRRATSMLGFRSLQSITSLRNLAYGRKGGPRTHSARSAENLFLGKSERPPTICIPSLGGADDTSTLSFPILDDSDFVETTPEALVSAASTPVIRIPFLNEKEVERLHPSNVAPSRDNRLFQQDQRQSQYHLIRIHDATADDEAVDHSVAADGVIKSVEGADANRTLETGFLDVDATDGLGNKGLREARLEMVQNHPSPLSSNPAICGGVGGDDETALQEAVSFSTEVQAQLNSIRGSASTLSQGYGCDLKAAIAAMLESTPMLANEIPLPDSPPTSISTSPTRSPPAIPGTHDASSADSDQLVQLKTQLTALQAANTDLLTLNAAQEGVISTHEATISRHEGKITELSRQLRSKDAEQASLVENFCAEMASRNNENGLLKEERLTMTKRIAELEKIAADLKRQSHFGGQTPVTPLKVAGRSITTGVDETRRNDHGDEDEQESPDRGYASSVSDAASALQFLSSPVSGGPGSSNGAADTPHTIPSSIYSPRSCCDGSTRGLYVATPTPSVRGALSFQMNSPIGDRTACSSSRRQPSVASQLTTGSDMVHGSGYVSERLPEHRDRSLIMDDNKTLAARLAMLAEEKATLAQDLAVAREKLATAENHNSQLKTQAVSQENILNKLADTFTGTVSSSAPLPIPDLPVLTYTTKGSVWLDRVTSSFKYLGLLGFIERDVPRPDPSISTAVEIADWTSRRLRAAIMLKQAVHDDLLEDVLYLCGRRAGVSCSPRNSTIQPPPGTEDPHQLLNLILTLQRTVPASSTDFSWIDRIDSADFDSVEGFASLVICVDKRHSILYGTSADHYDALLPKIQEAMARRFPDFENTRLMFDPVEMVPKKWWQLSIWMAKAVKRHQVGGEL